MKIFTTTLSLLFVFTSIAQACLNFQATLDASNVFHAAFWDNDEYTCEISWTLARHPQDTLPFSCFGIDHAAWISGDLKTLAYHAHGDDFRFSLTGQPRGGIERWVEQWFC
jgi:hypothetical protein